MVLVHRELPSRAEFSRAQMHGEDDAHGIRMSARNFGMPCEFIFPKQVLPDFQDLHSRHKSDFRSSLTYHGRHTGPISISRFHRKMYIDFRPMYLLYFRTSARPAKRSRQNKRDVIRRIIIVAHLQFVGFVSPGGLVSRKRPH